MHWTTWTAFTLAYTVMAAAPGPVIVLVMSYAVTQGRRTAFAVVTGTVLGDATCLAAAVLGLGALLAASATAFTILKLAGAAYLVFLGVKFWRSPPIPHDAVDIEPIRSRWRAFAHAYLVTVLNPKSVLFFMVFVPQFLDADAPLLPQLAAMLAAVILCGTVVDGGYTVFAATLRRFVATRRTQRAVSRVAGGILVGEGVLAAGWRVLPL
jgi:threonine/homoserine/homoserine lactone efflux protein